MFFPPIEDSQPIVSTQSAIASLREHTMQPLSRVEQGIAALRAEHGSTAYDITTPSGYAMARLRRAAVREVRYKIPKIVKEKKAELAGLREQVEEEGARIIELLREIEDPHDKLIEAEDARREAIRAEEARVEAERVAKHQANIDGIKAYLERCREPGMTADRILAGIGALEKVTFGDDWEEFLPLAGQHKAETLRMMRELHAQAAGQEAEAARQEAIRIESERRAAEVEEERRRISEALAEARRSLNAEAAARAAEAAAHAAENELLSRLAAERAATIERMRAEHDAKNAKSGSEGLADAPAQPRDAGVVYAGSDPQPAQGSQESGAGDGAGEAGVAHSSKSSATPESAPRMISIGDVKGRLGGLALTSSFIEDRLGVPPAKQEVGRGVKGVPYTEADFIRICAALIDLATKARAKAKAGVSE